MSTPLLTDAEKAKKCSEYSISSEDYFRCLKSANVELFVVPKMTLPGWAIALIIFIIFAVLIAFDLKYKLNYFSSFFNGLANLLTGQTVRRRY